MTRNGLLVFGFGMLAACSGSSGSGEGQGPFPLCVVGWWHGYPATCSTVAPQCQGATGATATQCAQSDCQFFSFLGFTIEHPDGGVGAQGFAGGTAIWSAKARTFMADGVEQGGWEAANGQLTTIDTNGLQATGPAACAPGQLTLTNSTGQAQQYSSFEDSALVAALNAHGTEGSWDTISY